MRIARCCCAAGILLLVSGGADLLAQPLPNEYRASPFLPLGDSKRASAVVDKVLRERERTITDLLAILQEIDLRRQLSRTYTFQQQLVALEQGVAEAATEEQKALRRQGVEQFTQTRGEIVRQTAGREFDAIRLLGQLRAAEAVPYLLKYLDLPFPVASPPHQANPFEPTHSALVAIGKPASRSAVAALAAEEPRITRGPGIATEINSAQLYVNVVAAIEGTELGQTMIRLAAEREMDPKRKQRLRAALDLFKGLDRSPPG